MSAKKSFALMHIEAMAKGKSVGILFGYRIKMEYQDRDIMVEIAGKRDSPTQAEIENLVRKFLLFSAPADKKETSARIALVSKRTDVFHF